MGTAIIPKQKGLDLPTFTILVNGQDVSAKYGFVHISVAQAINRIPVATVHLNDGSSSKQDFQLSASDLFSPGTEVIIKAGYHQEEEELFEGIVVKHGIKAPLDGPSLLCLELRHKAVKLTIGRKSKYYEEKKDSDIISDILSAASVTGSCDSTTVSHKEMVQYYCTDWDFILTRAEVNGLLAIPGVSDLKIAKPTFVASPEVDLTYGSNVISFEAEIDSRDQYGAVEAEGWDFSSQALVKGTAQEPGFTEPGEATGKKLSSDSKLGLDTFKMQHPGLTTSEELTDWASAKLMRSRLSKIVGRVNIYGTTAFKPGDSINLIGFGKNFNGPVYISGVLHNYGVGTTWITEIQFGLSQNWFSDTYHNITDKPSSGLLPAINGLHIGIVTEIEDPDGEYRVRIKVPVISNDEKGVWARIGTADAGPGRGIVIRPEEKDEVIVGFLNDDPRDPVILGMLHSKTNNAPDDDLKITKDNYKKGWVTREKIKFIIDEEKKIVTVETPGKNTIIIDDDKKSITLKDQNNNSIVMDDKGVTIKTDKDFVVKATGDVKVEGKNITEKAQSQFKATGNSGAEVSTSGQAVLKGSLVKIN